MCIYIHTYIYVFVDTLSKWIRHWQRSTALVTKQPTRKHAPAPSARTTSLSPPSGTPVKIFDAYSAPSPWFHG